MIKAELLKKINEKKIRVGVVGLGYVGLQIGRASCRERV